MSYYYEKTPPLGPGLAWNVMHQMLTQVKSHRGLTSFIERRGVNGRWLKPYDLYNIRITKLTKILQIKALYQNDDEFLDEWNTFGEYFLESVRRSDDLF